MNFYTGGFFVRRKTRTKSILAREVISMCSLPVKVVVETREGETVNARTFNDTGLVVGPFTTPKGELSISMTAETAFTATLKQEGTEHTATGPITREGTGEVVIAGMTVKITTVYDLPGAITKLAGAAGAIMGSWSYTKE